VTSVILKLLYGMQKYKTKTISVSGKSYQAIIADTSIKRAIGLMFRESLPKGACMLFIFRSAGHHAIWMRNMKFPIDVIWLNEKLEVVDSKAQIKPCESILSCPEYSPSEMASYLIEFNAGVTKREKIRAGSKARI
jgi:uncharacterized membrane protein (UPF0127 family)